MEEGVSRLNRAGSAAILQRRDRYDIRHSLPVDDPDDVSLASAHNMREVCKLLIFNMKDIP
jgi:hypothetical protein